MVAATMNFAAETKRLDHEIRPINEEQGGDLVDREMISEKEEMRGGVTACKISKIMGTSQNRQLTG